MARIPTMEILGCRVHRLSAPEVQEAVMGLLEAGGSHLVVTADSSALVIAQEDVEFRGIVNTASLVIPDSFGVVLASKMLGNPLPGRCPGVELAEWLCRYGAETGRTAYFFGAAVGVAQEAAIRLEARFPGLRVAGTRHGFFKPEEEAQIVAEIRAARPDFLMVALGIPKQEKFIARHLEEMGVPICVGVGGSLDCFSGRVKRAPKLFQRLNLEWLYRLCSNPKKLSKVMLLPQFLWLVLRSRR
ncbi:MAG TPA: WecB/TagA/CpsF family glycosyltransferase [Armatimonadota bacterium]|jgi:N-acetylglucosaminyldiphosphoundecaprenol N-acetyl-beta-D-mannosaminyltransferase